MDETPNRVPVTEEKTSERSTGVQASGPLDSLRRQVDRLFEDFDIDFWRSPSRRSIQSGPGDRNRATQAPHLVKRIARIGGEITS